VIYTAGYNSGGGYITIEWQVVGAGWVVGAVGW
jgi:hypothetical protein